MAASILRIEGVDGEVLTLSDATPEDQPEDWKPRWHLDFESPLAGDGAVTLSQELWDCEPTWLALFQAQLLEACFHASGGAHLATGSYPDVNLQVTFVDESGCALVSLDVWEADQQLGFKFQTDEHRLQSTIAALGEFLTR